MSNNLLNNEYFDISTLKRLCCFDDLRVCSTYTKGSTNTECSIHTTVLDIDNYIYDYEYVVLDFMKYRGCKILRTNYNCFGGFYIYYTRPTNNNTLDDFLLQYKEPLFRIPLWFPLKLFAYLSLFTVVVCTVITILRNI